MKSLSLKTRILKYIRSKGYWINGGEIERLALQAGFKASNASRRCRELENDGLIRKEERKGIVWYMAEGPKEKIEYFVQGVKVAEKVIY